MAGAIAGAAAGGQASGAVGGIIGMGVDAHVRNQNWSRQKRAMQEKYQWAVRDLRAAGLNPILAATGGISAGSAPSLGSSNSIGLGNAAASGLAAGTKAKTSNSEIKKNEALTEAAGAQSFKMREEGMNANLMRGYIRAETEKMTSDAKSAAWQAMQQELAIPRLKAEAEMWSNPDDRRRLQNLQLYGPQGLIEKGLVHGGTTAQNLMEDVKRWWSDIPTPTNRNQKGKSSRNQTRQRELRGRR